MTVAELITALSAYNPAAEVLSWCCHANGDVADDVGHITITGVADWQGEDKATAYVVHINCQID